MNIKVAAFTVSEKAINSKLSYCTFQTLKNKGTDQTAQMYRPACFILYSIKTYIIWLLNNVNVLKFQTLVQPAKNGLDKQLRPRSKCF